MNNSMCTITKSMLIERDIEHTDESNHPVAPPKRRPKPCGEMTTARKFAYRQLITDKLQEALAFAHECMGELEAEYDSLPYYIDTDGEYGFKDPEHGSAVERQRQDAIRIEERIEGLLKWSEDWFVVGWSYRFFFPKPQDVEREINAINAEMEEREEEVS